MAQQTRKWNPGDAANAFVRVILTDAGTMLGGLKDDEWEKTLDWFAGRCAYTDETLVDGHVVTLRYRANTAWLAFSRSRISRIRSGAMSSTGVRHISSNAFMVRFDMTPASVMPSAVSCTDASTSLPYRLAIAAHLADRPIRQHRLQAGLVQPEHLVGQARVTSSRSTGNASAA